MNERTVFIAALQIDDAGKRRAYLDEACATDPALRQRVEVLLRVLDNTGGFLESPAFDGKAAMEKQQLSLMAIFDKALEIASPAEREAYLSAACADQPAVKQKVDALLKAYEACQASTFDAPIQEAPGTIIGSYKLLEQIGEGGMGTVWVAEQTRPVRRKVALKLIKAGMDSKTVLSRFEAERQALALMDHPNIAKVLDGGTTESGRPFFAMEYVKGIPLTKYCDDARLSIAERLALFVPVCHAVQHAHQKGIIHRDLKPSNILVCLYDGQPVPKVIDFGLAKAVHQPLTEHTLHTAHGVMMGTPLYMSPEQAEFNNLDVDTRTDIYALGVILYELLTGTTPLERKRFKDAAWQEMLRLIKEEEPPKPSARLSGSGSLPSLAAQRKLEPLKLTRLVRGELDWIVMKALEKERSRRYETANGFARDIQRYLADETVEACPPSASYRLRKFTRKNRAALTTAATILLLLLAGVAVSTWQAIRATEAGALAKENELAAIEQGQEAKKQAKIAQENEDIAHAAKQKEAAQRAIAVEQADRSRRLLSVSDMNLAQQAWEAGDTGRARALLQRQLPQDLRGFEGRYLWGLCRDGSRETLGGHTDVVTGVAFAPDGQTLATSGDHSVRLWDVASHRHVKLLVGNWIHSVAFAPDGKTLAILYYNGVRLWDVAARCERATLAHSTGVKVQALSPDNLLAAGCEDGTIRIWDIAARREVGSILNPHTGSVSQVVFSHDGKTLASGGADGKVRLWDVAARRPITTLEGHTAWVNSLCFSPDGKLLASASNDTTVRLWDTATKQQVKKLWSPRTALTLVACGTPLSSLAFSPDSKVLATGGGDGTVRLWDVDTKEVVALLRGNTAAVRAVAFAPDGRSLVSGSEDGAVKLWDVVPRPDPNILTGHKSNLSSLDFSPDGKTLAVADSLNQTVKLWDMASRKVAVLEGHKAHLWRLKFAPGGQTVASTGNDKTVRLWDIASKKQREEFLLPDDNGGSAGFSPDGKLLAVGCWESSSVRVWDLASRRQVAQLTPASGYKVQFSPDGTLLAGGWGKTLQLWDVATWQSAGAFSGHTAEVLSFAFAPDGRTLAVGAADGTVCLWDVAQKRQLASRRGHTSNVESMAFSPPDGRRLATSGADSTIKLWDVALLQEVATLTGHVGPVNSLSFSPDGNTLASASADATVRLWHAPPVLVLREPAEAPSVPPAETIRRFSPEQLGTAQVSLASEGSIHRVDVTAIDATDWHATLYQVFDDLQEGANYTIRFRAKADAPRRMKLEGQVAEPDWHVIGLSEVVPLTEDWQAFQYEFQPKDLSRWTKINFIVGDRTGNVWIADFTVTKGAK